MNKILKYLITLGIISLIIFTIFELFIMPLYVRHGNNKEMVNVINLDTKSAIVMIKSSGFKAVVADTIFTSEIGPNIVLDQHPKAGAIVKQGRTVQLKVSRAEKFVEVPLVIGQSKRSANLILKKAGLKIGAVTKMFSTMYPEGVIINQIPDTSETLPKGYSVRVSISKGRSPNNILVPSLFGLSKDSAELELRKSGLRLGKVIYKQNEDLIPFTVLEQSIDAGIVLDNTDYVDITVSVLDLQDIFQDVDDY